MEVSVHRLEGGTYNLVVVEPLFINIVQCIDFDQVQRNITKRFPNAKVKVRKLVLDIEE
jgi:hypothetical protein